MLSNFPKFLTTMDFWAGMSPFYRVSFLVSSTLWELMLFLLRLIHTAQGKELKEIMPPLPNSLYFCEYDLESLKTKRPKLKYGSPCLRPEEEDKTNISSGIKY